ncbi:hypothetical protein BKA93DRAFT_729957 [Sparassis latifolia]
MNSTRLIDDSKTAVNQEARLRNINGHSYYRWILSLIQRKHMQVLYTPGHSSEQSVPAALNHEADHYASRSQNYIHDIAYAPIPTFSMNTFTYYTDDDRWIESNIRVFINHFLAMNTAASLSLGNWQRMAAHLYDSHPPPAYPYTHATAAYSVTIQLYARSGQLPTADLLNNHEKMLSNVCRFGCDAIEDAYHIFVRCPRFESWREETSQALVARTEMKLDEQETETDDQKAILHAAKSLFKDTPVIWPLYYTFYFLGHIPNLEPLLPDPPKDRDGRMRRCKLLHHLSADWHLVAIRLAGRIFGDVQWEMAKRNELLWGKH